MKHAAPTDWTKSSYSGQQAQCVEWRQADRADGVDVRDSKAGDSAPRLTLAADSWQDFVRGVAARA
ncbi:MAG: DUF397 domain-containing protein [Streptomycetaceae bacterium]|nr:DUF397 domain-containing protein [Streptomycetaceae bacterium]